MLKIGMTANRLEMDPPLSTLTGQTSGRGSNHILAGDTTKEVPPTSNNLPSNGIMEESISQMTTMLSNILERHGHANQHLASLEEDLAHAKLEEEKLKATIEALEKEKSEMNARMALMEKKDLYDLLEAKMEGFQTANHPRTIGGFGNLNLTITKKWVEIPTLNLEEFEKCPVDFPDIDPNTGEQVAMEEEVDPEELDVGCDRHVVRNAANIVNINDERRFALLEVNKALKMWRADNVIAGINFVQGHRTLQDEVDRMDIDVCYQSLLHALKAVVGTLPNSLAVFEYMRSIFDSYVNPTNDPNVQPLVKGLDADDFSMDKFFDLQDPTSPDDVQASPDFEKDLRTKERVRLRAEVRNLGAEPQWVTMSTRICLDYEPTILPDVSPTDNLTRPVTFDLTVDAHEDPSSSAQS
ncbi:hypothetical protein R1flu_019474 [Riccia fluitans]|uniref:Uncharacterized protein n=1 Tax=Riccia fluitans TaxID=41844 RepID=A0ABD1ZIR9_9MARC